MTSEEANVKRWRIAISLEGDVEEATDKVEEAGASEIRVESIAGTIVFQADETTVDKLKRVLRLVVQEL